MKKIFALLLVTLMMIATIITVSANNNGAFVSSPSKNPAPELIESSNSDEECNAKIVICAYADRAKLDDEKRKAFEDAYKSIVNAGDLASLNSGLSSIAEELQISSDKLAVIDLFDISYEDCEAHDGHGGFDIILKPHVLDNFVCLLHYNGTTWEIVDTANVSEDGLHLMFTADDLSPFAIVVHDGSAVIPSDNASNANVALIIAIIAAVIVALGIVAVIIFFVLKNKKKNTK